LNEFTLVKPRKDKQATTSSVWEEVGVRGGGGVFNESFSTAVGEQFLKSFKWVLSTSEKLQFLKISLIAV
jgi:hypothetical protein